MLNNIILKSRQGSLKVTGTGTIQ